MTGQVASVPLTPIVAYEAKLAGSGRDFLDRRQSATMPSGSKIAVWRDSIPPPRQAPPRLIVRQMSDPGTDCGGAVSPAPESKYHFREIRSDRTAFMVAFDALILEPARGSSPWNRPVRDRGSGAGWRIRTPDPVITNHVLCQLS